MYPLKGFPGGSVVKESACNTEDTGLIPGSGRSPGGGNSNCSSILGWKAPMDRGDWQAKVEGHKELDKTEVT